MIYEGDLALYHSIWKRSRLTVVYVFKRKSLQYKISAVVQLHD